MQPDTHLIHDPIIQVEHLYVHKKNDCVLENIQFAIDAGTMVAIIGPNGAGKSTLLHALVGLEKSTSGSIYVKNSSCPGAIAYVPQRALVDWDFPITVFEVVMMGRYPYHSFFSRTSVSDKAIVEDALVQVGMLHCAHKPIGQLSGGQQQRVFFARALAQKADIYFLDEPFAGVDVATELDLIAVLKNEQKKGKTIVVVHHDLQTVAHFFDTVLLLNRRLIAYGKTADILSAQYLNCAYQRSSYFSSKVL